MIERLESTFQSARHALGLVLEDVASVAPGWLVAGLALHVLHQVVRTRGWFTIIRAAYPEASGLRVRDVTAAYLAGTGLNSVVPARGGDLAKLYLIRRRVADAHWSTLAATFVPETLFETVVGTVLVAWALSQGLLPVPVAPSEIPAVDVSLFIRHPVLSTLGTAAAVAAGLLVVRLVRARTRDLGSRLRRGLVILGRPREFVCGVVVWQLLARIVRLASLACFMAAFALPVTLATVVLVMAAQGGGRIIPIAPVSAGLRIAMLTYGLSAVSGETVDIAQITAFSFGVAATLTVAGTAITIAILGRELGTGSPLTIAARLRQRVATPHPAASSAPLR